MDTFMALMVVILYIILCIKYVQLLNVNLISIKQFLRKSKEVKLYECSIYCPWVDYITKENLIIDLLTRNLTIMSVAQFSIINLSHLSFLIYEIILFFLA